MLWLRCAPALAMHPSLVPASSYVARCPLCPLRPYPCSTTMYPPSRCAPPPGASCRPASTASRCGRGCRSGSSPDPPLPPATPTAVPPSHIPSQNSAHTPRPAGRQDARAEPVFLARQQLGAAGGRQGAAQLLLPRRQPPRPQRPQGAGGAGGGPAAPRHRRGRRGVALHAPPAPGDTAAAHAASVRGRDGCGPCGRCGRLPRLVCVRRRGPSAVPRQPTSRIPPHRATGIRRMMLLSA